MTTNTVKPARLTKAILLKDAPICWETKTFQKCYDATVNSADLYTHEIIEIDMVVSGNGVHRVLNQAIPCKSGDIYITHSDTPHAFFAAESGDALTVRRLWFDPSDWFEEAVASTISPRFCHGVFSDGTLTAYAMLTERTQNEINGLINAISQEISEKRDEWRTAVRAHLSMLLITVSRYVGDAIKNISVRQSKEWGAVSFAIRTVMENFENSDLTLGDIADELYISKSHLSRQFKLLTGEPFSDYVRNFRINHACRLLKSSKTTVDDIAIQCGWRDIPSFYKAFNLCKGMTPHQYRTLKARLSEQKDPEGLPLTEKLMGEICLNLQNGKTKAVTEKVQQALDAGIPVETILNNGLLFGMNAVGERFKNSEVYVPEVLVAARAMNMGMQILKPYLATNGVGAVGRI